MSDSEFVFCGKKAYTAIAWLSQYIPKLDDAKEYVLSVKQKKRKRSNNANSYAWVLLDKLAEKLHTSKIDIYRRIIREIGGVSTTVSVWTVALPQLKRRWEERGIGWQTEVLSSANGKTEVVLYYGSSTYDSKQMSRLIDLIVQECHAQGDIETLTPAELELMKGEWQCEA